jgi:membrane-anchored protein YejM (alkaline phosphatase superfamily)
LNAPDDVKMQAIDKLMADKLVEFISEKPNMMFIHFDDIDHNGHCCIWGQEEYYEATKRTDMSMQKIFDALRRNNMFDDTAIFLTADHGGLFHSHGQFMQAAMYVPILARGAGIKVNTRLSNYVALKDIAPTALHVLGVPKGEFMVGRVVTEALVDEDCIVLPETEELVKTKPANVNHWSNSMETPQVECHSSDVSSSSSSSSGGTSSIVMFIFGFAVALAVMFASLLGFFITNRLRLGKRDYSSIDHEKKGVVRDVQMTNYDDGIVRFDISS